MEYSSLKSYAYVLECNDNKYYVGITYNLQKRLISHFSESYRRGSVFTNIYKPIKCIAVYDLNTESRDLAELYECLLTLHYSKIYGSENVAGGKFVVRDTAQRKRSIDNCLSSDEIHICKNIYKISEINLFEKIQECDIPNLENEKNIEPYPFNLIYEKTSHIEPLKKRLLVILAIIYRTKVGRITKIRISCINRSKMTIGIPLKRYSKYVEKPMEEGLLRLIETYYKNEIDKPIDYLFMSKYDESKRMGITDENYLIDELKLSL